jgi:uracil-DNA glycosylase
MKKLLTRIHRCKVCIDSLEHGVNPVVAASKSARIVIIGQAPGKRVHESGIPWDDPSGRNLRSWLGIDAETFYDEKKIALIPMGFCYPGKGVSGDLPPRKECAPLWHHELLKEMKDIKLALLIGRYAQAYYLRKNNKRTLTETVRCYTEYLPEYFPLPHPSPRNNIWQKKNPWFASDLLPKLKANVGSALKYQ